MNLLYSITLNAASNLCALNFFELVSEYVNALF